MSTAAIITLAIVVALTLIICVGIIANSREKTFDARLEIERLKREKK